mmetsp:Transcript_18025/g.31871  ORF Transcript_18025/g.31871 Transcript_18025/m.31871 type:complete len:533 (+) Transcript_18025:350-1948(+)
MGNAQKKLGMGLRGPKDGQSKRGEKGGSSLKPDTTEHVETLLKKGPIGDYYDVDYNTVLGRGHYATVNLGRNRRTGYQVAVKRIQISKSREEALKREVEVLRKVGKHPNIVTLYDIFITETELILVLELLLGGELFDRMVKKGPYSEREASHHVRKIGQALKFLHRAGIVHRDLKPENLLLAHKGDNSELKIADFGLANIVENAENATMKTVCGTWAYCAPEVKTTMSEEGGPASYTAKVDLWSVGVILFVILAAYHPFDADGDASDAQLWSNICSGQFDFDDAAWDHISASAKDLIRNLIVVDPELRYGTDELLAHPWVRQAASVPATPITPNINRSLIGYNDKRKSRKGFVAKVKRLNPLTGNSPDGHSSALPPSPPTPTSSSVSLLTTQPITKEDVLEQQRILEEQRHAEEQQELQSLHYQEQQELKQQQEQRLNHLSQQHQQVQQELLVRCAQLPPEQQQEQQQQLTLQFQQQVQVLQVQFHNLHQQLMQRQRQEEQELAARQKSTGDSSLQQQQHQQQQQQQQQQQR